MKNTKKEWLKLFAASFFGAGFIPFMPGTFGTIAALSALAIPDEYFFYTTTHLIFIYGFISFLTLNGIEKRYGQDPGFVVADEVIAMWLILLFPFIRESSFNIVLGLLLFRVFDIWKPLFIKRLNEGKGAFYIIADDIAAALLTIALLYGMSETGILDWMKTRIWL